MPIASCDGWVKGFSGQRVQVTGTVKPRGEHWTHTRIKEHARSRGGTTVAKGNQVGGTTLLVMGELKDDVIDPRQGWSANIVFVAEQRALGNHIHLVDSDGFAALLSRSNAPCLGLRKVRGGTYKVQRSSPAPTVGAAVDDPLGPRSPLTVPEGRRPAQLELDLDALDRGSAAHEATITLLEEHLTGTPLLGPGRGAPWFDAGWHPADQADRLCVAEVKSLTDKTEAQQVRLGLGQVLDYMAQLGLSHPRYAVTACLVLERQPKQVDRWTLAASTVGILLTWAPDFVGIAPDGTMTRTG